MEWTCFHEACKYACNDVIKFLFQAEPEGSTITCDLTLPLHVVLFHLRDPDIVKHILLADATVTNSLSNGKNSYN